MDNKKLATTLRKVAADLKAHKEKRAIETREKCAAVIVAKVGLNELVNKLASHSNPRANGLSKEASKLGSTIAKKLGAISPKDASKAKSLGYKELRINPKVGTRIENPVGYDHEMTKFLLPKDYQAKLEVARKEIAQKVKNSNKNKPLQSEKLKFLVSKNKMAKTKYYVPDAKANAQVEAFNKGMQEYKK